MRNDLDQEVIDAIKAIHEANKALLSLYNLEEPKDETN